MLALTAWDGEVLAVPRPWFAARPLPGEAMMRKQIPQIGPGVQKGKKLLEGRQTTRSH